jgi:hypothetical protein
MSAVCGARDEPLSGRHHPTEEKGRERIPDIYWSFTQNITRIKTALYNPSPVILFF